MQRAKILVAAVATACVLGWDSEPLHGVPGSEVALLTCAVLFGTGLLGRKDLGQLDWSTLLLIAGGIALGLVTAVVLALASSFGMPLPVSAPANALMAGEGTVRTRDFLVVGLPVMVGGVAVVVLTGPAVLAWWGVR